MEVLSEGYQAVTSCHYGCAEACSYECQAWQVNSITLYFDTHVWVMAP